MGRRPGIVGLGRHRELNGPAAEVAAGNDKSDTTSNVRIIKPTSPGDLNGAAVDNRVLSFPAVPGRFPWCDRPDWANTSYRRVLDTLRFIDDAAAHPSKPSDEFIIRRAVGILRHA